MSAGSIVNTGKNLLLNRLYNGGSPHVFEFAVGSGTTNPVVTDSGLEYPIASGLNFVTGYPSFDTTNQKVTVRGFIPAGSYNGATLSEVGEFSSGGGIMFSRDTFTGISKSGSDEVAIVWQHQVV